MDFKNLANDIQRCLNSLASLDIKSTENNMAHLWGSMQTLAGVRDTLRTYAEAQEVTMASGDPAGDPEAAAEQPDAVNGEEKTDE